MSPAKWPILLVPLLGGCWHDVPTAATKQPCEQVQYIVGTQAVQAKDPASGAPVAAFLLTQYASHWQGDLDCFFKHEYSYGNWLTLEIQNQTTWTVSFDYTITPDSSYAPYSGSVTRLVPGGSVYVELCSLACGTLVSTHIVVTTGPITYERPS